MQRDHGRKYGVMAAFAAMFVAAASFEILDDREREPLVTNGTFKQAEVVVLAPDPSALSQKISWSAIIRRRPGEEVKNKVLRHTAAEYTDLTTPLPFFRDEGVLTIADLERLGNCALHPPARAFFAAGAGQEFTLKENTEAFKRLRFRPPLLVDVSHVSMTTTLLGQRVSMPVGFSPSSLHKLANPIGEVDVAQGNHARNEFAAAEAAGTVMILSALSSVSLEDVRKSAPNCKLWMHPYVFRDRRLTEKIVKRAVKAGFSAVVLTADSPVKGGVKVEDKGISVPPPANLSLGTLASYLLEKSTVPDYTNFDQFLERLISPSVVWKDIAWLRNLSGLPIVVKGVLTPEAAMSAYENGAKGILVSNHGGRQLDGTPATIEVLPEVVAAVQGRMEVYLDGGVRSGADVAKALSLGARAVFVGRPVVWGLADNGKDGVTQVLDIFRSELKWTLQLLGCRCIQSLNAKFVARQEHYWRPCGAGN